MIEYTFAMIKPDAVKGKHIGKIINMIEQHSFEIISLHKIRLTKKCANIFYDIHKDKPFFNELVNFITSGSVIIMVLEKENAIADWRKLMGATDPAQADDGTIRKLFGTSIGSNTVHGSDAPETAQQELALFFPDLVEDNEGVCHASSKK